MIDTVNLTDSNETKNKFIDHSSELQFKIDSTKSYFEIKNQIRTIRNMIDTTKVSYDSISSLFTDLLITKIFPYWYGTKWAFDGYSQIPNKGVIACGYFVSITLRDMGINVNIYKLAQQLPINEAKSLCIGNTIIEIYNETVEQNISEIQNKLKPGIYFIGFDQMHLGYILKHEKGLYLIHSNYINSEGVIIEDIRKSEAFASFSRFYISEISTNKVLISKWLTNGEITVITE